MTLAARTPRWVGTVHVGAHDMFVIVNHAGGSSSNTFFSVDAANAMGLPR